MIVVPHFTRQQCELEPGSRKRGTACVFTPDAAKCVVADAVSRFRMDDASGPLR
jgi:hypothetical protein